MSRLASRHHFLYWSWEELGMFALFALAVAAVILLCGFIAIGP